MGSSCRAESEDRQPDDEGTTRSFRATTFPRYWIPSRRARKHERALVAAQNDVALNGHALEALEAAQMGDLAEVGEAVGEAHVADRVGDRHLAQRLDRRLLFEERIVG